MWAVRNTSSVGGFALGHIYDVRVRGNKPDSSDSPRELKIRFRDSTCVGGGRTVWFEILALWYCIVMQFICTRKPSPYYMVPGTVQYPSTVSIIAVSKANTIPLPSRLFYALERVLEYNCRTPPLPLNAHVLYNCTCNQSYQIYSVHQYLTPSGNSTRQLLPVKWSRNDRKESIPGFALHKISFTHIY